MLAVLDREEEVMGEDAGEIGELLRVVFDIARDHRYAGCAAPMPLHRYAIDQYLKNDVIVRHARLGAEVRDETGFLAVDLHRGAHQWFKIQDGRLIKLRTDVVGTGKTESLDPVGLACALIRLTLEWPRERGDEQ